MLVAALAVPASAGSPVSAGTPGSDGNGLLPFEPRIVFETPEGRPDLVTILVRGLSGGGPELEDADPLPSGTPPGEVLEVVAVDPDYGGDITVLPPVLGRASLRADPTGGAELVFRPRFPPSPGVELVARFDTAAWFRWARRGPTPIPSRGVEARFRIPELDRRPSTRVLAVHPVGDSVPANLLRLYVTFSAPMSARQVLPHVRLRDEGGEDVEVAFVGVPGGLWDPDRRRLTLLVHPGRVKRGVGPHESLGPVLRQGERYHLEVGAEAEDADGLPLASDHRHTFQVGPADYRGPDPRAWRLELPESAGAALWVELAEPADRPLLERLLWVEDPEGHRLMGQV
ncbi:MAG: hypothetical protein MI919_25065, partial [Holophagales bacterium]|nr:hypothetical protein [Holophagales bacterium]